MMSSAVSFNVTEPGDLTLGRLVWGSSSRNIGPHTREGSRRVIGHLQGQPRCSYHHPTPFWRSSRRLFAVSGRLHAGPEGGHELYGAVGQGRRLEKLLPLQLGLDDAHQRLPVLVAVTSRVERPRQELDDGESHGQLLLGELHLWHFRIPLHPERVAGEERLQHQDAVQRTQGAQPLLVTDRYLGHGG